MTPEQESIFNGLKEETSEIDELQKLIEDLQPKEEQVAEEEPVVSVEDQMRSDILSLFKNAPEAPDEAQIKFWKDKYGETSVRLFALDENNIYIYSYLSLEQWEQIQGLMQKLAGTPKAEEAEKLIKEHVIKTAVLWPKNPLAQTRKRAGLSDAIYQLIMINSYFLTPQQAMTMTVQL
jgi:hypothetical protein